MKLEDLDQGGDGATILETVVTWLGRYLAVPSPHCLTVLALWAAHTHVTELFYVTPRLILDSAEPESGKTRALELLNLLCRAPIFTLNTTIAAIYRRLNQGPRTLLLDETDAIFSAKAAQNHEDLRALLNAGYKRGASVDRCVPKGNEITVVEFPAFAPAALAGIAGNMPPTITTRAITIHMRRRSPDEQISDFIEEDVVAEALEVRDQLAAWVTGVAEESLRGARPDMPAGVRDRQAEIWRSLLAITDAAGGDWPKLAREACRHFVVEADPGELSLGVRLLADLRAVFGDRDRMFTAAILEALRAIEEAPWGDLYGKQLDSRKLSKLLGKYHVKPKSLKIDGTVSRGYSREDLHDVWKRYLRYERYPPGQHGSGGNGGSASDGGSGYTCPGCGGPLDPAAGDTHPGCGGGAA